MAVKKYKVGKLRSVGHFENNTAPVQKTAGYVDGYTSIITSVWCKLWPMNGRRTNDFGEVQLDSTWGMQCRFQSAIDSNIKKDTKFVQGDRVFTVVGFNVIDERDFYYQFTLNLISA